MPDGPPADSIYLLGIARYGWFSLREHCAKSEKERSLLKCPEPPRRFDGTKARCGIDRDGILLWIQLPEAVKSNGVVSAFATAAG